MAGNFCWTPSFKYIKPLVYLSFLMQRNSIGKEKTNHRPLHFNFHRCFISTHLYFVHGISVLLTNKFHIIIYKYIICTGITLQLLLLQLFCYWCCCTVLLLLMFGRWLFTVLRCSLLCINLACSVHRNIWHNTNAPVSKSYILF